MAVKPGGSWVGIGGISPVRFGQSHWGSGGRSLDALFTVLTITSGKLDGIIPRCSRASLQRNAFVILFERYTICLHDLSFPVLSLTPTINMMPPSTPRSSLIAPLIDKLTGIMSFFLYPIDRAVSKGIIEL